MRKLILLCVALFAVVGCKDVQIDTKPEITPELEVEKSEYLLDYMAQEVVIVLRTNQLVDVKVSEIWIMSTVADSGDRVVLYLLENKGAEPRTAEVIITAGDLSQSVTIVQGVKPESMQLTLGHTMAHLDSPEWGGSDVKGSVDWGDGTAEEYSEGISHDYGSAERYNAQFTMEGATSFYIERIGDIESITIAL